MAFKPTLIFALLFTLQTTAAQAATTLMQPEDVTKVVDVSTPVISPDGSQVVYVLSQADQQLDQYTSDLWIVPYQGGAAKPLTKTAPRSEWAPQYSPDGKRIAFLSEDKESESTQLFIISADGSDEKQVSHVAGGVIDFTWAPDNQRIVFSSWVGEPAPNHAGTAAPIVINRFQFMEDEVGYLTSQRRQLFILDSNAGSSVQITAGDQDFWMPAWSPDGKWIAYVSKDRGDTDRNMDYDIFIMPPKAGAKSQKISQFKGTDVDPYWLSPLEWSPDSRQLVWLQSAESKWIYYAPWQLTVADIYSKKVSPLARIDRCFYLPKWSGDGKSIYALVEQDKSTWLANISLADGAIKYFSQQPRFALDFDVAANGNVVLLDGNDNSPFELYALGTQERQLSHHNQWLQNISLGQTQSFSFTNDGHEISGLMLLPANYKKGQKLPAIFRLHGGPVYQFSHEFMSDWQVYAANGYAVVAINPRGSSGKGFDFSKAIYADWGNVDVSDILAGSDYLIKQGIIDGQRLGLGGWSYGGILSNYVIASDTRFKAAISGAGAANMLGTYGHDQYSREYELELGTPWQNFEAYKRVSFPFLEANKITTPTLYQCSEKDFNVPCLGAEQMYQALKSLGVDTQLVIYPGQYHGISVPSYLNDRMQRNLAWYNRYLK